ncbi:hypothetical protein [Geopseudomonas aromaticivorans]
MSLPISPADRTEALKLCRFVSSDLDLTRAADRQQFHDDLKRNLAHEPAINIRRWAKALGATNLPATRAGAGQALIEAFVELETGLCDQPIQPGLGSIDHTPLTDTAP